MRIDSAKYDMNGAPADNIFIAYDNNDQRVGTSAVVEYVNDTLLPDRPLNYYITLDGFARARDMLFGAAYAKARVLRARKPELPARIYASCSPRDPERLMFFTGMGFDSTECEYIMRTTLSNEVRLIRPPVGMSLSVMDIKKVTDVDRMLSRINKYSITSHSHGWLEDIYDYPLAAEISVRDEDKYVGEAVVVGYGNEGSVLSIYSVPHVRRHGVAMAIISAAHDLFMHNSLSFSTAKIWSRFIPAMNLFEKAGYRKAQQALLYPGVNLG